MRYNKKVNMFFFTLLLGIFTTFFGFQPLLAQSTQQAQPQYIENLFSRVLNLGNSGQDVLLLQQILNLDPITTVAMSGPGSLGNETTYFGQKTKDAVIRFQQNYDVDTVTTANGYVTGSGRASVETEKKLSLIRYNRQRSAIPQLSLAPPPVASAGQIGKPQIMSATPYVLYEGNTLTLQGNNFAPTNTVNAGFDDIIGATSTNNGHTIQITFHSKLQQNFDSQLNSIRDSKKRDRARKKTLANMEASFASSSQPGLPLSVTVHTDQGDSNLLQIFTKLK